MSKDLKTQSHSSSKFAHRMSVKFHTALNALNRSEKQNLSGPLKEINTVLKEYPKSGDAMCVKGSILVRIGEREEGMKLVQAGIKQEMQSYLGWQLLAMIRKGEHNLKDALGALKQAVQCDPDNYSVLREVAVLQTQLRHYDELLETRLNIVRVYPYARSHWVALAIAYKLNGKLSEASEVLEHMDNFMRKVPRRDADYGEFILFRIRTLEEMGKFQEALSLLDTEFARKRLVDNAVVDEFRARLLSKLKNTDAGNEQKEEWTARAETVWLDLIKRNCDCYDYYKGFLANKGIDFVDLTDATRGKALGILQELSGQHPKANAPRRLALTVAEGERFKELVTPYIEAALQKGIPSLFGDLKKLYSDPFKRQTIQEIVEEKRSTSDPTYYLWTLYFLAQHYSFLGQQQQALDILAIALQHTPTLPELYMAKARVLKRAGDPYGAVRAMDDARRLDGQDRYINTKSGKYRLRAGMVQEAEEVFGLFTKKEAPTPGADLLDMQALHYLKEVGDAQRRNGKLNLALKNYYAIERVFGTFHEDQQDFHQYVPRRNVVNAYVALLEWEDSLSSHPAYIHAVVSATQIWVKLSDDPSIGKALQPVEVVLSGKDLSKARKAARRTPQQALGDLIKRKEKNFSDQGLDVPFIDTDPSGLQLVLADDPLEKALAFLNTLENVRDNVDVCLTVFDVAIRRKKYLQAGRALRRIHGMDAQHPELHLRIVQLCKAVNLLDGSIPTAVRPIVEDTLAVLKPAELSLEVFNSQYIQLHSRSAKAILACAKVLRILESSRDDIETLLFTALTPELELQIKDASAILSYLQELGSPKAEEFRIACDHKFELSTVFKSADEQVALRRQCLAADNLGGDDGSIEVLF